MYPVRGAIERRFSAVCVCVCGNNGEEDSEHFLRNNLVGNKQHALCCSYIIIAAVAERPLVTALFFSLCVCV